MNAYKRIILACLWAFALGLAPAGAAVAQVRVTAATPSSADQGTTLDVIVSGSGFDRTANVRYLLSDSASLGGIIVKSVTYKSSKELVTTIVVAPDAQVASFDIEVMLEDGRKGKGTSLFAVKARPNDSPPPTYPANRAWHSFTSNEGTDVAASRLYMYGGSGSDLFPVPADLWIYRSHLDQWTLIIPSGSSKPGGRQHAGFSCGAGACVLAMGSNGFGLVDETWIYVEATNAWTQAACRRTSPCPSPRQMTTMVFDPERGKHLLFGGRAGKGLNDTQTFDTTTLRWQLRKPTLTPPERNRAAATYVPGIGAVMHGGQTYTARIYCDMYAWNGSDWARITFDTTQAHPCLHTHSVAWDGRALVVTGGFVDTRDTPSTTNWRFTFAPDGKSGTWSTTTVGTCQPVSGTDAVIHPGARMAYDGPTATRVWFGGEESVGIPPQTVRYGNTVECYGP